jgi:hypothetical protein
MNFNFLEKFKPKKVFKKENNQIDSSKYWNILFYVFLTLFLASIVFGYFIFQSLNTDFILNTDNNQNSVGINQRDKIKKTIQYFEQKEENSNEIINSGILIVDPSL